MDEVLKERNPEQSNAAALAEVQGEAVLIPEEREIFNSLVEVLDGVDPVTTVENSPEGIDAKFIGMIAETGETEPPHVMVTKIPSHGEFWSGQRVPRR